MEKRWFIQALMAAFACGLQQYFFIPSGLKPFSHE